MSLQMRWDAKTTLVPSLIAKMPEFTGWLKAEAVKRALARFFAVESLYRLGG